MSNKCYMCGEELTEMEDIWSMFDKVPICFQCTRKLQKGVEA